MPILSQEEIIDAVSAYLRRRGDMKGAGYFRWRFGVVGEPEMTMIGPRVPDAGKVYIEWSYEHMPNVEPIR